MTYLNVGSITIPAVWIAIFITLFITPLIYRILYKKKVEDWYWNGFFFYILVWKLSYIVFNLKMFLDMPLSIIYFNGGTKGNILGLAVLSFYLFFIAAKKYRSFYEHSAQIFLLYYIIYEAVVSLLEQKAIEGLCHSILLIGYLLLLYYLKKNKLRLSAQLFIVVFLSELMIMSIFSSFFSKVVLTFSWIGCTILIAFIKSNEEDTKLD